MEITAAGIWSSVERIRGESPVIHNITNYVVMNKDKWNSIPANAQKIIEQVNEEWIEKMGKLWDELDKEGKDVFVQKGGKVFVLSKEENARWSEKLRPILDEYVKSMKAKGLPGDEALKFCLDYLKARQK